MMHNFFRWFWLLCFGVLFSGWAACEDDLTGAQAKGVSFTLENGLTIILYPRQTPVISCVTCVKTGSTDEPAGLTGTTHLLERLAFKGTPHIGVKDYEAERAARQELDKVYANLQAFERQLPEEKREYFWTLAARAFTWNVDKIKENCAQFQESLAKSGGANPAALLGALAEKISAAERQGEPGEYASVIARNGGEGLNAFTSADCAIYQVSLPANKLELWAALESDRFMNFVPRQFEKERLALLEERRRRSEAEPFEELYETLLGAAFPGSPYGISSIGLRPDILRLTPKKTREFYQAHFTPRNTVIAIVGGVDVPAARQTLTTYFSRLPDVAAPAAPPLADNAKDGERRVEVEFPSPPLLLLAYHVPERKHADTPALLLLNELASSGHASRLNTNLVQTGKASSSGSWLGPGTRFPRLFFFSAEPPAGGSVDELEKNLLAEIENLAARPPSKEELGRATTACRAASLRRLRSDLDLARELAGYQALNGDWRELFREIQKLGTLRPEDLATAAKKYFVSPNRIAARIISTNMLGLPVK